MLDIIQIAKKSIGDLHPKIKVQSNSFDHFLLSTFIFLSIVRVPAPFRKTGYWKEMSGHRMCFHTTQLKRYASLDYPWWWWKTNGAKSVHWFVLESFCTRLVCPSSVYVSSFQLESKVG